MRTEEQAYAKLNLVLRVGAPRPDGLHPLCSLFASLELADEVTVEPADADAVECPEIGGENLAGRAVSAFRSAVPELPRLRVAIRKRIPVAAGLGGASADAAAVLRAANRLSGAGLEAAELRRLAAGLGSDVPSQVEPCHALVTGVGEQIEPVTLPSMSLVLVPQEPGLSTAVVYAELDRIRGAVAPDTLDPTPLRRLAAAPVSELAGGLANDLQPAAVRMRPQLDQAMADLVAAGALGAAVTGSGPTAFGVFADRDAAEAAAAAMPGAMPTQVRRC